MLVTCTLAVFGLMNSSAPIWALVRPVASNCSTTSSRLVSPWLSGVLACSWFSGLASGRADSGTRARSASLRICESSGAFSSAASAPA
jgi:hypothetical protein